MENHPIKAIMDLSHLVRRATEQQMADLEISSYQMTQVHDCLNRLEQMESKMNGWLTPEERSWWIRCINKLETGLKEAEYD